MAQNPWDNDPIVTPRSRLDERERAETRYRNTTGDRNPLAQPVILPGEEGYAGEGQYLPAAGVVVRGQAPWDADPIVTDSQIAAAAKAAEIVGTNNTDNRENALYQGVTFGFADEMGGNLAGWGQQLRNIGNNLNGDPITIRGADLRDAVIEQTRTNNAEFRETNPGQSLAFELAGGVLSGGVGGGARASVINAARSGVGTAATRAAARQGLTLTSMRTGLVTGGAYGAGAAEGSFGERLLPAAVGAGIGAGAGAALQMGTNTIGQRLGSIAGGQAASRTVSPVVERAQASRWAGIDPTMAGVGGPVTQKAANALGGVLPGAGPVAAASARAREQTIGAVDRIAGQYGTAGGRDSAGQVLRRGAETGARALKTEGGDLYAPINALEQNPTPIPLTASRQALDESLSIFTTPELRQWFSRNATDLTDLNNVIQRAEQGVTFAEARQLRSVVGSMLNDPTVFNSRSQAGLRRLYGALSDDVTNGAEQLGGAQAARDLGRADRFYSASRDRADRVLQQFVGADNSSQAYQRLLEIARSTGRRSDWQQLRQLRDSIPADDWNEIGAGVIRSLGGEGENFSPAAFVTEWKKMTPQARRTLFGGADRADQFRDLNNLARVLEDQKNASRFYNFSESGNTAGNLTIQGTGIGATGAAFLGNPAPLAVFLATAATANLGARALTSPGVARWLASPPANVIQNGNRLAARNREFATFWNANREAIVRALQNPTTGPVGAFAETEAEARP